jgi:uncharacterized protein DUF4082
VPIKAGIVYVASYFAPEGGYDSTDSYFVLGKISPPLHALSNNGSPNRLIERGGQSSLPRVSTDMNYRVDVVLST